MSLIKCEECGKEISSKARTCPHCGAKPEKNVPGWVWLTIILLGMVFVSALINGAIGHKQPDAVPDSTSQASELELSKEQAELIRQLQADKLIDIEANLNTVYIAPLMWAQIDAKAKEGFARSLAIHCGNTKGTNTYWVKILDKMTGIKLAEYSEVWGFKVY